MIKDTKEISLTREVINKIISFFHSFNATIGYARNTPIGEIADHAYHHWERVSSEIDSLRAEVKRLRTNYDLMKISKESLEEQCERLIQEVRYWHLTENDTPNETEQVLCLAAEGVDYYFVAYYRKENKEFVRFEIIDENKVYKCVSAKDVLKWKYIK